jgi:hypothetical protein
LVNPVLRVLRGVVRTAVVWGVLWALAAGLFVIGVEMFGPGRTIDPLRAFVGVAIFFTGIGAWAGGVFALMMAAAERRHSFAELSTARVALWGAAGGVSLPLMILLVNLRAGPADEGLWPMFFCTVLGTLSAWGMLAVARRARGADAQLGAGVPEFSAGSREAEHVAR